jgi:hypothetical protein
MIYLKFGSNTLSLDMDSFENILGCKRLLWKPIGNYLVCSSLYHLSTFFIFKAIAMANIIDFDSFRDAFGDGLDEKMIGIVIGALTMEEGGVSLIVWKGHPSRHAMFNER